MKAPNASNSYDTREAWLRAAANQLRPYFESCGLPLPEKIRYAIGFTSTGRKSKRVGECWHPTTSEDATYEIFIRADLADPLDVLGALVKELVHTALPADASHGRLFKGAAIKVGLEGPMRMARPGVLLKTHLADIAAALGPLPHARLHLADHTPLTLTAVAVDRPKKQRARMHKAECADPDCDYLVRVAAKPVREKGPPHCPQHGPMRVTLPPEGEDSVTDAG